MIRGTSHLLLACAVLVSTAGKSRADDLRVDLKTEAAIAPFLDDQAIAVVAIDLTAAANTKALRAFLEESIDSDWRTFAQAMLQALSVLAPIDDSNPRQAEGRPVDTVQTIYVVATWSNGMQLFTQYAEDFFLSSQERRTRDVGRSVFVVVPGATKETLQMVRRTLVDPTRAAAASIWDCREINSTGVIAASPLLDQLTTLKASERLEFAEGLEAVGIQPVRIAVAAPPLFSQAAREILRAPISDLNQPLGSYVAEIRWVAVGTNLADHQTRTNIVLRATGGDQAVRLVNFTQRVLPAIGEQLGLAETDAQLSPAEVKNERILWNWASNQP